MNINKALGILIVGASVGCSHLVCAPLEESYVAKDAKWLAHVDVEALKDSMFGLFAIDQLKTQIANNNDSKISIDVDMLIEELKSVTAYGSTVEMDDQIDAVLILRTGKKLPAILEGFLAHESLTSDKEVDFKLVEDSPYTTYLFGDELYVSNPEEGLLLASKRFEQVEKAYAVVKGKADNISKAKKDILLNREKGFFLIATTAGLNDLENMPPQARILQKTTGVQVSLGESNDEMRANLVLGASDSKVSQQLYRIVQGMLALVSFATIEDQAIADIVNGIDVRELDDAVSIDLRYSSAELMKLIETLMSDHGYDKHGNSHGKSNGDETSWFDVYENIKNWEKFGKDFAVNGYASNFSRRILTQ